MDSRWSATPLFRLALGRLPRLRARSFGRGSGLPVDGLIALSAQSRDGRLTRICSHPDVDAARAWASAAS